MKVLSLISGGESFKAPVADADELFDIIRTWAQKAKVGASLELLLEEVPSEEFKALTDFAFPTLNDVKEGVSDG